MKTGEVAAAAGRYDVIVVGSGVAGLRAAIEAAEGGRSVALLAKDSAHDSNTDLAQGGVAGGPSGRGQGGPPLRGTPGGGGGGLAEGGGAGGGGGGPPRS